MNSQRRLPGSVVGAAALQLLTVVPFALGSLVVLVDGAAAQQAAEAEVVRQGLPASILARHGISFGSNTSELPIPIAIGIILVVLALLNLAGFRAGRLLSWVFHPILFVAGCLIVPGQIFTAQFLQAQFKASGDPMLERLDVQAVVGAGAHAMPVWLPEVDVAKLLLTTLGSLLVIVLLLTRSARAHARRRSGPR
jgi:hypothetical protein